MDEGFSSSLVVEIYDIQSPRVIKSKEEAWAR